MRNRKLALVLAICIFCINACSTTLPTSERLENVKAERQELYKRHMALVNLEYGSPAFIRIIKSEAQLELWVQETNIDQYRLYKTYPICNYSGELGPKLAEGDKQAPEGFYTISADQMNPWSRHHLSFNLGFPNEYDLAHERTGSALMIHGGCSSIGCYAMTDDLVEEVYLITEASIAQGHNVPVHIFPFRMNAMNMHLHRDNEWIEFWQNLKQGYDAFKYTNIPPDYAVDTGQFGARYVFDSPYKSETSNYGF